MTKSSSAHFLSDNTSWVKSQSGMFIACNDCSSHPSKGWYKRRCILPNHARSCTFPKWAARSTGNRLILLNFIQIPITQQLIQKIKAFLSLCVLILLSKFQFCKFQLGTNSIDAAKGVSIATLMVLCFTIPSFTYLTDAASFCDVTPQKLWRTVLWRHTWRIMTWCVIEVVVSVVGAYSMYVVNSRKRVHVRESFVVRSPNVHLLHGRVISVNWSDLKEEEDC